MGTVFLVFTFALSRLKRPRPDDLGKQVINSRIAIDHVGLSSPARPVRVAELIDP